MRNRKNPCVFPENLIPLLWTISCFRIHIRQREREASSALMCLLLLLLLLMLLLLLLIPLLPENRNAKARFCAKKYFI